LETIFSLYAIAIMHNSEIKITDVINVKLIAVPEDEKITVYSLSELDGLDNNSTKIRILSPVFKNREDPRKICTDRLLRKRMWDDIFIEVNEQFLLDAMGAA